MKHGDRDPVVTRLFDGLEPTPPPAGLRSDVLAAARARLADGPPADRWTRAWNHRGLRLGWAAAIVLLLIGHVLATPSGGVIDAAANRDLVAGQRPDAEVVGLLRPVRISEGVQPIVGRFAAAGVADDLDWEGNDS